jgi:hypothetical protein
VTPHKQTILDDGNGDCFRTCVASLFDLPVEQVPHFLAQGGDTVTEPFRAWLKDRGLECVHLCFGSWQAIKRTYFDNWGQLVILSGRSPRLRADGKSKQHAVIAKCAGYGLEFVHDPHPDNSFLDTDTAMFHQDGVPYSPFWVWFVEGVK